MNQCSLNESDIRCEIVESTYDNVKMTTQEDLVFGEIILRRRQQEEKNDSSWTRI